ncbi:DUF3857 domain-containing protein [Dysgonomonas sp. Marseille-P4361]|uniref:DUF3857 domain-containing protein n=1 Tax=Dysgonomonas sp. Marseille-P4361 TaxID=2161820 RepID=UPI000D556EC9|nr:DUF3857 domain-containing protein [Dysgonomonas sp. Marseille-P4361]
MSKRIFIYFFYLLGCIPLFSQNYPVSDIPEVLEGDAVAVVRNYSTGISQSDKNNMVYTVNRVVTILNEQGDGYAHFYITTDKFTDLTKFSGVIRDASGKEIKKFKKGDLVSSSLDFESFTTGSYNHLYECISRSYPFTVEYNYEVKTKNGVRGYPPYVPIWRSRVAVEKANYKLEVPSDIKVRHHSNYAANIEESTATGKKIYKITEENIPAIKYEIWEPQDLYPIVNFAPADFCYDSQCGNMETWKEYGLWVNKLLEGRDILPAEVVATLQSLVGEAKNEREKVKILYEYLQQHTRYVSIPLGIGGYQPETAANVYKTKFGDCKGLTNLMKAMLKAVDIKSNYCVISMGDEDKRFFENFPSFRQANHVILLVPIKNDSIWLECTSAMQPFGFVHSEIADHDVLVVSDEGGKLCRTPAYERDAYMSRINLTINVDEEGNASGNITLEKTMDKAVEASRVKEQDRETQIKYLRSELKMPKVQFADIDITYRASELPSGIVKGSFEATNFANKTGNRLFVQGYPLNKGDLKIFASSDRTLDIEIPLQYVLCDTITYILPEGFVAESLPKDLKTETQFGTFSRSIVSDNNQVISEQRIDIKPGVYKKEAYNELKDFFGQIDKALSSRLIFRKN